jgi:3-oxoacyl-[acyl-carrier protein] reductase
MNIVLTGASSGVGYELAKKFSSDSANTVFVISRNVKKLNQLQRDCHKLNSMAKVISIPFDLASTNDFSSIVSKIASKSKSIDLLINNAGLLINKPFQKLTKLDLLNTYTVNVFAPYLLTQAILPLLKKSKNPQVINIGSIGGVGGTAKFAGLSAYSSSKGALTILSECLAEELKENGIRVNCLALGSVNTEMLQKAFPGYKAGAEPSEMADFIVNFAIKEAVLFNGKTIQIGTTTP